MDRPPGRTARLAGRLGDLLLLLPPLALAAAFRFQQLDTAGAKSDEGIRLQQLFLMTRGFRPVRDIFASQGPLSLDATYPLFVAFGGDLAAARLAVVVYSLVGVVAAYLCVRQLGLPSLAARFGGLVAGLLLAVSPTYLENSRTALVEVPALVPALLAIAAGLRYRATGSWASLALACLLMSLALLIKPLVAAATLPVVLACLPRLVHRPRDLLLPGALSAALTAMVVLAAGPVELYDQVIRYRVGSRQVEGWSLAQNWAVLLGELRWEGIGVLGLLAAVAAFCLWRWRTTLPLLAWAPASLALLLVYSPLMEKHAVALVPPLAVLAGAGCGVALQALLAARSSQARAIVTAPLALGLLAYLASAPVAIGRDRQLANPTTDARDDAFGDDVALLAALAGPDDFVIVDEPYVAFLARRMVPPSLADPTVFRLRSGTLTGSEVVAAAERYDVRTMLLWSDGLRELRRFDDWTDQHFQAVKLYERSNRKDRAALVRAGTVSPAARGLARGRLEPRSFDFGGQLRLAAAGLETAEVRAGGSLAIGSEWEALADVGVDYHVLAILRTPQGRTVRQTESTLGGGGAGTAGWHPGRWVVRTINLPIPRGTPAGEYEVALALYDSKARQTLPLAARPASGPPDEAVIGTVRVR